ncbi:MAG: hypothetical protein JNN13_04355 [Planctomycetes bacterium]|nr:hypothetical protein [Planctomycetota bacterium]
MSEHTPETTAAETKTETGAAPPATNAEPLSGLMAGGEQVQGKAGRDLDTEALRAAEAAIAEGERALANARAQLQQDKTAALAKPGNRGRELLLRGLLVFNVVAMVIVALLPAPTTKPVTPATPPAPTTTSPTATPPAPTYREPFNQAVAAAERREFARAVAILDGYLADSPRLMPGEQLEVLNALAYYASRNGDVKRAEDYRRRADSLEKRHSLPEDLVAQAKAALENGDQESLRRTWARFLLQQRQIPSWLYKHVAEAYLQLGDSYRAEAATAAERERIAELEALDARLREQLLKDAKESHK